MILISDEKIEDSKLVLFDVTGTPDDLAVSCSMSVCRGSMSATTPLYKLDGSFFGTYSTYSQHQDFIPFKTKGMTLYRLTLDK